LNENIDMKKKNGRWEKESEGRLNPEQWLVDNNMCRHCKFLNRYKGSIGILPKGRTNLSNFIIFFLANLFIH
jgi:hypothetical protein